VGGHHTTVTYLSSKSLESQLGRASLVCNAQPEAVTEKVMTRSSVVRFDDVWLTKLSESRSHKSKGFMLQVHSPKAVGPGPPCVARLTVPR
jgi:hypothetical protein